MPTSQSLAATSRLPLAALAAAAALCPLAARAQTDDAAPFYVGASLGATHVSNVYRQTDTPNSDTVVSAGLLGGIDQKLGRQHLTLDGTLQNNRYSTNRELNYRSHSLRGALDWQTVGDLSGVISAKSDRSLADFNSGNLVAPIFKKNIERNDDYRAVARLGLGGRYSLEAGWNNRRRNFSAEEYAPYVYHQDTTWLGAYARPGSSVRLGLVGRHTKGTNPRTLTGNALEPFAPNDYTRDDFDLTAYWSADGSTSLNARVSRSKSRNSLSNFRGLNGTTGAVGGAWQPTGKLKFSFQYSRDTGQEASIVASDLNRIYTSWQLGTSYALTGKITLGARVSSNRTRRSSDAVSATSLASDATRSQNLNLRWAISRSFSLSCQYDHVDRESSVLLSNYKASSYGCSGQAVLY